MKYHLRGRNNYDKNFIDSFFMESKILNIGEKFGIFETKIPDSIWNELQSLLCKAKEIKDHPLGKLKCHYNEGKNSFQVSVNKFMFHESYLFPYILFAGQKYIASQDGIDYHFLQKRVFLRDNPGHYDHYDFWFNFSSYGDENPMHGHGGSVSSVIYIENTDGSSTDFENGYQYFGKPKYMILFPAFFQHSVKKNLSNKTRITASFNLIHTLNSEDNHDTN